MQTSANARNRSSKRLYLLVFNDGRRKLEGKRKHRKADLLRRSVEGVHRAVLSPEQVRRIRDARADGIAVTLLAERFRVSTDTIRAAERQGVPNGVP